ncbi:hypothetical protein PRIPAC_71859 [Pristionchus pacificus]|uniref:Uncharacterized protein n=1 Tax=Pristionchus pacificus TaxID=54126 RepID=A0A2A6CS67_PRIPA|nr:hypothetical protein PRIPAC_71859 [Pristionchus pacificus]|eukprot:PDM80948.1 hypothetical protein PRIPAC_35951 [Pristionchus pacificus]
MMDERVCTMLVVFPPFLVYHQVQENELTTYLLIDWLTKTDKIMPERCLALRHRLHFPFFFLYHESEKDHWADEAISSLIGINSGIPLARTKDPLSSFQFQ